MRALVTVDAAILRVVQEVVTDMGYELATCSDPVEAIGLFITRPFEVFVCDLRKGEATGIEVASTMRRLDGGSSLKVVFLVRDRGHGDTVLAKVGGAYDVAIHKDAITVEELTRTFDKVSPPRRTATGDLSGSWPTMPGDAEGAEDRGDKPLSQKEKTRLLVMKLRRERERVQDVAAHEILRLSANPDRSDIEEARRTLKRRYLKVVKSDELPNEAKAMAAELAALVDHAYVELCSVGPRAQKQRRVVTDQERLDKYIAHARELVEQQQWDRADKLLAQARLIKQDDPVVLALAGWSRYHNPILDKPKREEHAKDLMMMAEQFDPHDFDCQYFLAQYFQATGDIDGAWRRIVRATRADAEHQGAKNLLQKIKKVGGKNLIPEDQVV